LYDKQDKGGKAMSFNIASIEQDGVKLEVKENILLFSGNMVSQNPRDFLDPFFSKFHEIVVANNSKEVTIDIRQLSFLN